MPIVSSIIVSDSPQKDGRRYIRERHTFDDESFEDVVYLCEEKDDPADMLPIRAAIIEQRIEDDKRRPKPDPVFTLREVKDAVAAVVGADKVAAMELRLVGPSVPDKGGR